jgi:N-acetylglutamate synthase-like GNAT family acetyltransferase
MTIYRNAEESDLDQVLALLREIMEHHDVVPPSAAALSQCVSTIMQAQDHMFLVAEQNSRVIGMCALLFSMSTWSAAPVCEIQDLIVTRTHRGANVGRGLVEAAGDMARARGCTRVFMLADYSNLQAHAFYRRLGLAEQTCLDFEQDLRVELP